MTIKGTNVIGLKIISLQDGKEIGKVEDLIYDPDEKKIAAVIVKKSGLFSDPKLILINNVKSIGDDALIIENDNLIINSSEAGEKISSIAKHDTYITRNRVVTDTGVELGTISDLLFDPTTGYVEKFEVSQGGFKDLKSGKKYVNISQIETIGKDVIIVKPQVEETIKEQEKTQGIQGKINEGVEKSKNILKDAKTNIQEKSEDLKPTVRDKFNQTSNTLNENKEKVQENIQPTLESFQSKSDEVGKNIQDKVTNLADSAKAKISEVQDNMENRRKQDAVGRYLTINILTPNDEIVAKRGDMITNHLIKLAEDYGLLPQVLNNNSEKPLDIAS